MDGTVAAGASAGADVDIETILKESDSLHRQVKWQEDYEKLKTIMATYLKNKSEQDWNRELVVRWTRALFLYGKFFAPKDQKEACYREGLDLVEKLLVDEHCGAAHFWYASLLDGMSEIQGLRARVNSLQTVEKHLRKAAELLPNDPLVQYAIGKLIFEMADLPWLVRSMVKVVYGDSMQHWSFELALEQFLKADKLAPDFLAMNTACIGKCYLKAKQNDIAIPYLQKAAKWQARYHDDEDAKQQAISALKHLGIRDY